MFPPTPGRPVASGQRGVLVASLSLAKHCESNIDLKQQELDPLQARRIEHEKEEETWVALCSDMAEFDDS